MSHLTITTPIEGPAYDKTRPETRAPWMQFRMGGITATEIRDWPNGSKQRQIIDAKISESWEDLSSVPAIRHGNLREPQISAWIQQRFGISPCESVFARAENPRHLASPDGVLREPFGYQPGTYDAVLAEIKTSKYDLTPGLIDDKRVLQQIKRGSKFDQSGYYVQMQWQMYVMNAMLTLFAYEQHDGKIDPETGTYTPIGVPEWCWVQRDEALIERLVVMADAALDVIDAARAHALAEQQPADEDETDARLRELAKIVVEQREIESEAKRAKEAAWAEIKSLAYVEGANTSTDFGFAKVNVTTSTKVVKRTVVDEEAMTKRAPVTVQKYLDLRSRYTSEVEEETSSTTLTVVPNKGDQK